MKHVIETWIRSASLPTDFYDLLGRRRFDPDHGELQKEIRAANRLLLPYQNHPEAEIVRRARMLQMLLAAAEGMLNNPTKLAVCHSRLLDELRQQFEEHARAASKPADCQVVARDWLTGVGRVHPSCIEGLIEAICSSHVAGVHAVPAPSSEQSPDAATVRSFDPPRKSVFGSPAAAGAVPVGADPMVGRVTVFDSSKILRDQPPARPPIPLVVGPISNQPDALDEVPPAKKERQFLDMVLIGAFAAFGLVIVSLGVFSVLDRRGVRDQPSNEPDAVPRVQKDSSQSRQPGKRGNSPKLTSASTSPPLDEAGAVAPVIPDDDARGVVEFSGQLAAVLADTKANVTYVTIKNASPADRPGSPLPELLILSVPDADFVGELGDYAAASETGGEGDPVQVTATIDPSGNVLHSLMRPNDDLSRAVPGEMRSSETMAADFDARSLRTKLRKPGFFGFLNGQLVEIAPDGSWILVQNISLNQTIRIFSKPGGPAFDLDRIILTLNEEWRIQFSVGIDVPPGFEHEVRANGALVPIYFAVSGHWAKFNLYPVPSSP